MQLDREVGHIRRQTPAGLMHEEVPIIEERMDTYCIIQERKIEGGRETT